MSFSRPLVFEPAHALPDDAAAATLAGRVWRPDVQGQSVVVLRDGAVHDVSRRFPTIRDLCEEEDPVTALRSTEGEVVGSLAEILANTPIERRDPDHAAELAHAAFAAYEADLEPEDDRWSQVHAWRLTHPAASPPPPRSP